METNCQQNTENTGKASVATSTTDSEILQVLKDIHLELGQLRQDFNRAHPTKFSPQKFYNSDSPDYIIHQE